MVLPQFSNNPLQFRLSFHKVIEGLEQIALTDIGWHGKHAQSLLEKVAEHPELKDGITDIKQLEEDEQLIADLLAELFPAILTHNEIKAVSIPYRGLIFNQSERFKAILKDAGPEFEINIRDFDDHQFYVLTCCIILNQFYGTNLDFAKPLFYDIPTAGGLIKHYRILYNADFVEIIPTENAIKLTPGDIKLLMDNYDNLALWKEKFPEGSWILKGFTIMTLIDVTVENALSILKSNLLGTAPAPDLQQNLVSIFRSIFRIADMQIGFTSFNPEDGKFNNAPTGQKLNSFLLPNEHEKYCEQVLCDASYENIIKAHTYFTVSDVSAFVKENPDNYLGKHFKSQNIESIILAPVVKDGVLLGVLELVSPRSRELNSVTANKLEIVMPFLVDTLDRKVNEMQNRIQAVIQDNYTTLHPSVYWKFKREAINYIQSLETGLVYTLKQIVFTDVYPLYGQVDIKDSSITRNLSVKNDLLNQLNQLILIVEQLHSSKLAAATEQHLLDLKTFVIELDADIKADTEQSIQHYLETHIYPILSPANHYSKVLTDDIADYFNEVDALTGGFHKNRRDYEKTLSLVNEKLVNILDKRQAEIQEYLPHYYERFKTDGVEHSLYIGSSILQNKQFKPIDLRRLRLWELLVTAEMEIAQHHLKPILPYHLDVASLILVFSASISIRFRMDEKHFDIDGAYNIRYEVIKKRIDKAYVKNTKERITQPGKITIVYSGIEEEEEYMHYLQILQRGKLLTDTIEHFEVEDLQGVSGLKAMRVAVLYDENPRTHRTLIYDTFYQQL
ncbi:MAG TPA: GAF domain-containing protein [Mucilaginibacter sp.]